MRDDVLGLAAFRALPSSPKPPLLPGAKPTPPSLSSVSRGSGMPLPKVAGSTTPSFANVLRKATAARTPTQPLKPYQSPLARTALPPKTSTTSTAKPSTLSAGKPLTTTTTTTTSTLSAGKGAPTTVDRTPPKPVAPPPEPTQTDPTALASAAALALSQYPHPNGDNGRGMHWVPTTRQEPAVVDRFVAEAQRMGVKWVTFLNNGANIGDNDYLVKKLVGAGIEPVMRLYSPTLEPIQGDIEAMVRHFTGTGVHYFQPFNEPNLNCENPDGKVSVDRYLDAWIPAAQAIVRGGGLPGFGSLAPGGDYDDQQFMCAALDGLRKRGAMQVLDRAWISMHNYTWNHPIEDRGDGDGFFKFRAYQKMVHAALGRDLPIIGTEGGSFVGEQEDPLMPAVTSKMAADWTAQSFRYMRDQREPWLFASSVWTIADLAGGGSDPRFEAQSLFRADGTENSIVSALRTLG